MTPKPTKPGAARWIVGGLVALVLLGACLALAVLSAYNDRLRHDAAHPEVVDGSVECETLPGRDYVRVSGNVENTGTESAGSVELALVVYDGQEVARASAYSDPIDLAPGQRGVFDGTITIAGAHYTKCVARVVSWK